MISLLRVLTLTLLCDLLFSQIVRYMKEAGAAQASDSSRGERFDELTLFNTHKALSSTQKNKKTHSLRKKEGEITDSSLGGSVRLLRQIWPSPWAGSCRLRVQLCAKAANANWHL